MLLIIFTPFSPESWSKSCKRRCGGLVAFIITLMRCQEAIFVDRSTIDFPIFLLFFYAKFPIFPIFSVLSFLFSYFFEQQCHWTPCMTSPDTFGWTRIFSSEPPVSPLKRNRLSCITRLNIHHQLENHPKELFSTELHWEIFCCITIPKRGLVTWHRLNRRWQRET